MVGEASIEFLVRVRCRLAVGGITVTFLKDLVELLQRRRIDGSILIKSAFTGTQSLNFTKTADGTAIFSNCVATEYLPEPISGSGYPEVDSAEWKKK